MTNSPGYLFVSWPGAVFLPAVLLGLLAPRILASADATLEILGPAPGIRSTLTASADGNSYGTSYDGGSFGAGTIFRMTPTGQVTILKSFAASSAANRSPDGSQPASRLVLGPDGLLFGSTTSGGASDQPRQLTGDGTVFSITTAGEFRKIVDVPRGAQVAVDFPEFGVIAPLTFGRDGSLYGSRSASVFKLSLSGNFMTLAAFPPGQGHTGQSQDPVIVSSGDGYFYGTENSSDHFSRDFAFRMDSSGTVSGLGPIEDTPTPSSSSPGAPLLEAADGNLYGFSPNAVFKLTKTGTRTTLHQFSGPDGAIPLDSLIQGVDGNFYGTTSRGGANDPNGSSADTGGTVFRMAPDGTVTTLVSFDPSKGTAPNAALAVGTDGCFYGTTSTKGPANTGTIFRLTVFPPRISATIPVSNQGQGKLIIRGQFFSGTTNVTLDGNPVSYFGVDSPAQITVILLPGQTSGALAVTTPLGSASLQIGQAASSPILNLSSRLPVFTGDNALIGGFIISGTENKKLLLRAVGPSLEKAGISNALQDPTLELHDQQGAIIASNDNWRTTQVGGVITADQAADIQNTGLAPTDDTEAAILVTLPPAPYTAVQRGANNTTGVGLVELYDLSATTLKANLANISTRGLVLGNDNIIIGGFIIAQPNPTRVIVRGIGPSLSKFGVSNALSDPTIDLRDGNGAQIAFNGDWRDTQEQDITDTTIPPSDPKEAAIVATLTPGNYTAIVRGDNGATGVGLVEIYNLGQ